MYELKQMSIKLKKKVLMDIEFYMMEAE